MIRYTLIFVFILFNIPDIKAQLLLTESDAVKIGLENNYAIRLQRSDLEIAENNNTLGNAGFLPQLSVDAGQSYSITDSKQEFLTGQMNDRKGAKADAFSAAAQLNWTLFDGLQMFTRADMLSTMEQQSELELLLTVENNIFDILATYYSLVQLTNHKKVILKTLEVDQERVQLAAQMLDIGAGSRLELLQAEVDRNADSALLLGVNNELIQLKTSLNNLLGREPGIAFAVSDSFAINPALSKNLLQEKMLAQNTSLLLSTRDIKLAELSLKSIKGRKAPSLDFNLGYTFNDQNSEAGFLKTSRTNGLTYGVSARMNLFDGLNLKRETQNAKILLESSKLNLEALENEMKATLHQHFESYRNNLQLLNMETHNVLAARENLIIATERFRLGDLSGLEFREAQRNFVSAESRLLNARLQVKLSETNLLQLAGELVIN
ncbi:MAG: outer membrane protein [Bacteroidales bacterium]|nr:outer membrane protein [Bacteroidales bacterium]